MDRDQRPSSLLSPHLYPLVEAPRVFCPRSCEIPSPRTTVCSRSIVGFFSGGKYSFFIESLSMRQPSRLFQSVGNLSHLFPTLPLMSFSWSPPPCIFFWILRCPFPQLETTRSRVLSISFRRGIGRLCLDPSETSFFPLTFDLH